MEKTKEQYIESEETNTSKRYDNIKISEKFSLSEAANILHEIGSAYQTAAEWDKKQHDITQGMSPADFYRMSPEQETNFMNALLERNAAKLCAEAFGEFLATGYVSEPNFTKDIFHISARGEGECVIASQNPDRSMGYDKEKTSIEEAISRFKEGVYESLERAKEESRATYSSESQFNQLKEAATESEPELDKNDKSDERICIREDVINQANKDIDKHTCSQHLGRPDTDGTTHDYEVAKGRNDTYTVEEITLNTNKDIINSETQTFKTKEEALEYFADKVMEDIYGEKYKEKNNDIELSDKAEQDTIEKNENGENIEGNGDVFNQLKEVTSNATPDIDKNDEPNIDDENIDLE